MMQPAPRVVVRIDDGIATVVFDNPAKHNAMTAEMFAALSDACTHLAADPAVRVVVLRGAGEKAFVSGADIGQLAVGDLRYPTDAEPNGTLSLFALDKPVVALVRGYCFGGGVMIAIAADIRICSDDTVFSIPAAKLGVGYPFEAVERLVALVGPGHAAELLYAGHRIDASEAARIGLVNRVVPGAEIDGLVAGLAARIAANAPLSHVAHKRSIRVAATRSADGAPPEVREAIAAAWASEDFAEGARAFAARRSPVFRGV